jgi:hypothetical protein
MSGWSKMPLWARWVAILFGFPFICAVLDVVFVHWLGRLAGEVLLLVVLIVASIFQFGLRKRKPRHIPPPQSKKEKQREKREVGKLTGVIFGIGALVCFAGAVIGFYGIVAPTPASYSSSWWWLVRVAMGGIGIVGLLMGFICFKMSISGFRA